MFKKPSDLWGDDPDMKKAESSKQAFIPFVFPELKLLEYVIDPITKEKKVDDKEKPLTQEYNVFERFIDIIVKSAEGKAVLKATGFLDLDKIWEKSEHPHVKTWRNHIPKGKTLNLGQMFPNPYSGRKLYYGFVMFVQDFVWESVETDQTDAKGNKIKKNSKKYLIDEKTQEPINRLGGFQPNKAPRKGGSIEFYTNSWQLEEVRDYDQDGNTIKKQGKEMVYWKSKGYINDTKVVDWFVDIEKQALDYQKTDPTLDKVYLWFIVPELKAPAKDAKYPEHTCTLDYMVLPK